MRPCSVSSSSELATRAGMAVLGNGGNAVDAAIAVAYVLAVVNPEASGPGGGGGMLVYMADSGSYDFFDYLSCAPSVSSRSSYGVPGFVAGLQAAWERYGTVPIGDLIEPAIVIAETGFAIDAYAANYLGSYSFLKGVLFPASAYPLRAGEILVQPALAEVLREIQRTGADGFYSGSLAKALADDLPGISVQDLRAYRVEVRKPVFGSFGQYTLASAPPPFSGITLIQMLEALDLCGIPDPNGQPVEYIGLLKRIGDIAYADRVSNTADPDFYRKPYENRTSIEYVEGLLEANNVDYDQDDEGESTTHFSVCDSYGNVVSCTNTLNSSFGSQRRALGAFYMNNATKNFGSDASINSYKPGKKPRTFISPTIVTGPEGYAMAVGSPGGSFIPKILVPFMMDVLHFDLDLQECMDTNRFFFSGSTLEVEVSGKRKKNVFATTDLPYRVSRMVNDRFFGGINVAGYSARQGYFAVADPRRDGFPDAVNTKPKPALRLSHPVSTR